MQKTLRTHLSNNNVEHQLRRLLDNLAGSAKYINALICESHRGKVGTTNGYGEEQVDLDVLADNLIKERLEFETSFHVRDFASEERGEITVINSNEGIYSVTADPIDGSSLVDVNLSIGTIFGIHKGKLIDGRSARESMVAAAYFIYGPETTLVYSAGKGVHEFVLNQVGDWELKQENIRMDREAKIYSPGALRKDWTDEHREFIEHLEGVGYRLRYTGALVADFNHILMKHGGIFCNPAVKTPPHAKLRLVFEEQPLAYIAEDAGGRATTGVIDILNVVPKKIDDISPFYFGSQKEVGEVRNYLSG
jgi:fructose-1,6-bisphosphatase I